MNTLILFIARISIVLYILIAVGVFFSIRGVAQARRSRRVAAFGLEREAARDQQRNAVSAIIVLTLLAGAIYVIDAIVEPTIVGESDEVEPTSVVFVTQEPSPTPSRLLFPTITPTIGLPPSEVGEAEPTPEEEIDGCEIFGATITSPEPGRAVSGQVSVTGEANILNFSQYKFELKGAATGDAWIVVGTYVTPVNNGLLGVWDATSLAPGSYTLRLVVNRSDGSNVAPCEVPIVIVAPNTGS